MTTTELPEGRAVAYQPGTVWDGWWADLRDGAGMVETGWGATRPEALADLRRRLAR
jgi:hypothetical protein